jgi:hypothetical protein
VDEVPFMSVRITAVCNLDEKNVAMRDFSEMKIANGRLSYIRDGSELIGTFPACRIGQ